MSEKYIHDRFLPDKAIDILDEACSRINLNNKALYQLEVLKNDYLHYQKGPEFYTYSELVKDCIDYFLLYLELLQKTFSLNERRSKEKEA